MRPRVLLANSDPLLLSAYRTFLVAEGFDAVTASTGLECMKAMRQRRPDLLVIDTELPWGSGLGVLALMRDDPNLADVPVLIVTGSPARVADVPPTLRGYALLVKPVPPSAVAAMIQSIGDGSGVPDEGHDAWQWDVPALTAAPWGR